MPIYRIRCHSGHEGGANHYWHADVWARSPASAMKAARDGRVHNWRWIDTFDKAGETYRWYELLYRIDNEREARSPHRPWTPEEYKEVEAKRERAKVRARRKWERFAAGESLPMGRNRRRRAT